MRIYSIQAPDGFIYDIQGPEGASEQDLFRAAQAAMREREYETLQRRAEEVRNRPAPPPETTFMGHVGETFKGVIPGAIGLLESAGTGISALLPEEAEKATREAIKSTATAAKAPFEAAPGYEQSFGRQVGEGLGSMLPMAPLGFLGLPGIAAGIGIGVASGAGEARTRAEQAGATEEERATATGLGIAPGALDAAVDMALAAFPGGKGLGFIRRALASGGIEGATEAAQEVAQNAIAKGVYAPEQELVEGAGESATVGGAVGVLASLLLDAAIPGRRGVSPAKPGEETPPTAPEVPPETPPETPPVAPPTAERPQGELFPAELEAAQRELESVMGPAPEPATAETTVEPERDTRTRDMIDELETADIEKAVEEDKSAELRSVLEREQLKLESDIAELDGRIEAKEKKTTQDNRLQLLLPLIELRVPELKPKFIEALKAEGFTNTNLTPRENALIKRAKSVFEAVNRAEKEAYLESVAEPEVIPDRGTAAPLEALIPEKKRKPTGAPSDTTTTPQPTTAPAGLDTVTGAVSEPTGVSDGRTEPVAPAGVPPAPTDDTARVETPEPSGLGDSGQPVSDVGVREVTEPGALAPEPTVQADNVIDITERLNKKVRGSAMDNAVKQEIDSQLAELVVLGKQNRMTEFDLDRIRQASRVDDLMRASFELHKLILDIKRRPTTDIQTGLSSNIQRTETAANDMEPAAEPTAEPVAEQTPDPDVDAAVAAIYPDPTEIKTAKQIGKMRNALAKGELPENISDEAKTAYAKLSTAQKAAVRERLASDLRAQMAREVSDTTSLLDKKDSRAVNTPLSAGMRQAISKNDVNGALGIIAGLNLGRASNIARQLQTALKGAVDVVIDDLDSDTPSSLVQQLLKKGHNIRGKAGAYVRLEGGKPTVVLDKNKGTDVWTFLHEATHAAVNDTLNTPSHPLTKQLTNLFEEVKPFLDSAYGATDVKEFAAEARSNPEFQRTLSMIDVAKNVSAWAKFTHSIRNFVRGLLGLGPKPITSALDATDKIIDAIITGRDGVTPAGDDMSFLRKPGESYYDMSKRVLNTIDNNTKKLPSLTPERVGAIHELFVNKIGGGVRNIVRQTLSLHALCEVASKEIPMAMELDRLIGQKTAEENARNQEIEQTVKQVDAWAAKNPDLISTLGDVVYPSTLNEVDPSDPREFYENFWMSYEVNGKTQFKDFTRREERDAEVKRLNKEATDKHTAAGGKGKITIARATGDKDYNKMKLWQDMQADWDKLGPEGQAIYMRIRDSYKALYGRLREALDERIDASVTDENVRKKLKNELYERLFASGTIRPYFPLTRKGDYWLAYTVENKEEIEAFATEYERDLAHDILKKDTAVSDIRAIPKPTAENYKKTVPPAFVRDVLQSLSSNEVDANVSEEIMRLFLNTLPETSFAHSLRSRKGLLGFDADVIGAFREKPYNISRQISNMKWSAKLEKLRGEMRDHVKTNNNTQVAKDLLNELSKRIDFAISPNIPQWSQIARSLTYGWTLGLNVSSALISLVQVPQVVAPYLGGAHGYKNTTKAIGRAMKYFTNSGFSHTVNTMIEGEKVAVRAGPSLDNYDFTSKDVPKHLETLVEVARNRGQLTRSQTYDMLGYSENASIVTRLAAVSGFMQHHTERMARQVTLAAAYELKLQDLVGKDKKLSDATKEQQLAAAEYAVTVSELTSGGVSAAAAPRIAQGPITSVIFMYKKYGFQMYYTLFRTAKEAFFTKKPAGMSDAEFKQFKGAAQRQITGICAMTLLLAGVQGLPMFGMAAMLYNLLLQGEDEDDFDTAARKFLKEGMYSGAVNALTGTDIASRISLSDLIFRDSMTRPSEDPIRSFMEYVGGPAFGVTSRVIRGVQNINEGEIQRGVEQILPSAVGNALKSMRYATEGVTTARGDPIVEDIGYGTIGAQFFGFAPAEYTRQLEINSKLKAFDRDTSERRTKLLRQYYVALRMGDGDGAAEVMDKILKFNDRYPENAITPTTIKNSMAQHMKTSQEMYSGITISKPMRARIERMAEEYEDYE